MASSPFPNLFSPLEVGSITLRNRIVFGPHVTNHWLDLRSNEDVVAYYEERAKGGVGLIIIGSAAVDESADCYPFNQLGLWADDVVEGLSAVSRAVHRHGCKVLIQLLHPGLHQNPDRDRLHRPAVSASGIPDVGKPFYQPRSLPLDEIPVVQDRFAAAAERAQSAGVDGVELQFAHGYLVNQFLTPLKNKRTDRYGGSLENRLRFGLEIIDKVRERVDDGFVLGVRLNNSDMFPGGLEVEDYAQIARAIDATGKLGYLSVSTALLRSLEQLVPTHYAGLEPGYQSDRTAQIRSAVANVPVFQVGRINTPALAESLIAEGVSDAVVMVRELIADPHLPRKAGASQLDDIRPCVYWNQGCVGRSNTGLRIECSLNPATAHEREYGEDTLRRAERPTRVLVIGGGPAGLECARVASLRGHDVVLYEAASELGGQVRDFVRLPGRGEVREWLTWLEHQVGKLKVSIQLDRRVATEDVVDLLADENPGAVVVATGARPSRDGRSAFTTEPVRGWEQDNVLTYEEVLGARAPVGDSVMILDEQSDRVAPGLAEMLATSGKQVEIVTRWPNASPQWLSYFNEIGRTYGRLDELGVVVTPNTWVHEISGSGVSCYNVYSGRTWSRNVDTIVLVTMKYSNVDLYEELGRLSVENVHCIGDAVAPRWVTDATRDAVRVAYAL